MYKETPDQSTKDWKKSVKVLKGKNINAGSKIIYTPLSSKKTSTSKYSTMPLIVVDQSNEPSLDVDKSIEVTQKSKIKSNIWPKPPLAQKKIKTIKNQNCKKRTRERVKSIIYNNKEGEELENVSYNKKIKVNKEENKVWTDKSKLI